MEKPSDISQSFNDLLNKYQNALAVLERKESPLTWSEMLEVLTQRDRLQEMLVDCATLDTQQLIKLVDLDHNLKDHQVQFATNPSYAVYRQLLNPKEIAWWWFLKIPERQKLWHRYDWLFNAGTLVALTISASLITDSATRLFAGGIDLGATLAVFGQSLALLIGGGSLTQTGREAYGKVLESFKINKRNWPVASFGVAIAFTILLGSCHTVLPHLAKSVNKSGETHFMAGHLDSARKEFQRAIALKPDYGKAHFNLAMVYEDLQQLDKAKTEYWLVVTQLLDHCKPSDAANCELLIGLQAHNNLARLHILDQKYDIAAPLLQTGLRQFQESLVDVDPTAQKLKYDFLKNLGWLRLQQMFLTEAENFLLEAKSIELDPPPPDADCLLAQLFEVKKNEKMVSTAWEQCLILATPIVLETKPEVSQWAAMAQEKLSASGE